jgi:hypothetical protein
MFSGWTRGILAFSPLVAGASLIAGSSLISLSALFAFAARFALSACITRLTRVSGLACGALLSGLAGVSRRPRWPRRWRRACVAPADEQR